MPCLGGYEDVWTVNGFGFAVSPGSGATSDPGSKAGCDSIDGADGLRAVTKTVAEMVRTYATGVGVKRVA